MVENVPKKIVCANRSAKPRFFAYISVSGFQITTLRHCTFVGGGGVDHVELHRQGASVSSL